MNPQDDVNFFSDVLGRLKHALRVSKDQEVAAFLGLSKTAFAERKRRGSFPEQELQDLCDSRPDLKLSFQFIMDGAEQFQETHDEFIDRMQGINEMEAVVDALPISDESKSRLKLTLTGDQKLDVVAVAQSLKSERRLAPIAANDYVYVPRYDVQASAGNGSLVHDESVVDHLAFKREWITRNLGLDPARLALIDVAGDSMAPTIGDGDLILIDTRPTPVKSEGVYVINLSGALLVKRLRMRLSGVVDVVSDNERYGTETISGEQLAQLAVLGRVVWQGRRI